MKKHLQKSILLASISVFAAFSNMAHAQNVNIPDANFKAALVGNLSINTNADSEVQVSEAAAFSGTLDVNGLAIADLTGIEAFTTLAELWCNSNLLTSLDVSVNTALIQLHCGYNQLTSLDVSANTAVTELRCNNNQLTSLDVTANTALTYLYCSDNPLTSLDVSANTALTYLNCYSNLLTSLDVSANTALTLLACHLNPLTSLDVSANTALTYLSCYDNQLTSLDVSANTALISLYCYNNSLTSLDISANTDLEGLYCYFNQLASLNVSANTALTQLWCYNNPLTNLNVSTNTALTELYCGENQLTSLDVSANTALTQLSCSNNQLTSLDVSANTALTQLRCAINQLTILDVSANTVLTALFCDNNQLTSLDLSANTALTFLTCNSNQLTNLNVQNGNNNNFLNFNAINNPNLSCIQVDNVAWSTANWSSIDTGVSFSTFCLVNYLFTSVIKGRLYNDKNSNCIFDGADHGFSKWGHTNWIVKASKPGANYYTVPDSSGNYTLKIDTGNYTVTLINPSQVYSVACPVSGNYPVTIATSNDTVNNIDFSLQTQIVCSRLRTSVNASLFRPCLNTQVTLDYCNEGTQPQSTATIKLNVPSELTVLNSSIPWDSSSGNTYYFNTGVIQPGSCNSITLNASVLCDPVALMNATLCLSSEISPAEFCTPPDTLWDKSSVKVTGKCQADTSVCFTIQNSGSPVNGNMQGPSQWRLYADNVLVLQGTFQLQGGQDTILCFPANGQTFRLEADQRPLHPGHSRPRASVERCGTLSSGQTYSLGQILSVPADNSLPFAYEYCGLVLTSYDPNDKAVIPSGITSNNYTSNDDRLEYKINFQNTGNDTAFYITIRDTLDLTVLDLSTLVLGSVSHPYNFTVEGPGILVWRFDNILLPDSNVNEPLSHGYVSFSIDQLPGLPMGTQVTNSADIYFDYNPPVTTNIVNNTVCKVETPSIVIGINSPSICLGDTLTFQANTTHGGSTPAYQWKVNGIDAGINDSIFSSSSLSDGDTITCELFSAYMCALPSSVSSNDLILVVHTPVQPSINFNAGQLESTPASSYQWYLNGQIISGATSQNHIALLNGSYEVEATDSNGCVSFSAPYFVTTVSVPQVAGNKLSATLYPNPSTDETMLVVQSLQPGKVQVILMNVIGQQSQILIDDAMVQTQEINIPVSTHNFNPGVYIVQVRSGEDVLYLRLLVSK